MKAYLHVLRHAGTEGPEGVVNAVLTRDEITPFSSSDGYEYQTITLSDATDVSAAFIAGWNAAAIRNLDERTDEEIAEFRDANLSVYLAK